MAVPQNQPIPPRDTTHSGAANDNSTAANDNYSEDWDETHPGVAGKFNLDQVGKTTGARLLRAQNDNGVRNVVVDNGPQVPTNQDAGTTRNRGVAQKQNALLQPTTATVAAKDILGRAKSIRYIWLYMTIVYIPQLALAVLSIVFFGLAYSVNEITTGTWLGRRVADVGSTINNISSVFGFDFSVLHPQYIWLVLEIFMMGIFFGLLLIIMFMYLKDGQRPIFGSGSLAKIGTLILATIGYALPIANLMPWLVFYLLVMARYPR